MRITAGQFKGRTLLSPKSEEVRPTLSLFKQALFNILGERVEGAKVLDLFAGSGALSFEALSREASHATLVEKNAAALTCIQANSEKLGVQSQVHLLRRDAFVALKELEKKGEQFDLIMADPPYKLLVSTEEGRISVVVHLLAVLDSLSLLKAGGDCFIEHGKGIDLSKVKLQQYTLVSTRSHGDSALSHYRKMI